MTTMKKFALLTAAIALGTAGNAYAANISFKLTGTLNNVNWANGSNWQGGVAPGAGDVAEFPNAAATSITFTTNIPASLDGITVAGSSMSVTLAPSSSASLGVGTLSITAGQLVIDTNQTVSISTSAATSASTTLTVKGTLINGVTGFAMAGTLDIQSGATMTNNARLDNTGAITIGGLFDSVNASVNLPSGTPTVSIGSGGIMRFEQGTQGLHGTGTLSMASTGEFQAFNNGAVDIDSTITISDASASVFRVSKDVGSSASLAFENNYTLNGVLRLIDTSSTVDVPSGKAVAVDKFYSPYSPACNGKTGTGTFSWSTQDTVGSPNSVPTSASPC